MVYILSTKVAVTILSSKILKISTGFAVKKLDFLSKVLETHGLVGK